MMNLIMQFLTHCIILDLNEFNEMFSDALSMSEEYCGECQRVCVTVFENKEKTYEELFFDANKATEWFIERGFA